MLSTVKRLVSDMRSEIDRLKHENKELKRKLQFRHTTINDLRYAKR